MVKLINIHMTGNIVIISGTEILGDLKFIKCVFIFAKIIC